MRSYFFLMQGEKQERSGAKQKRFIKSFQRSEPLADAMQGILCTLVPVAQRASAKKAFQRSRWKKEQAEECIFIFEPFLILTSLSR